MEVLIRNEREEDTRAVEEVTREAFWNLYVPGCSEHYIVHTLRRHVDFIPELDFVAVVNGRVVGTIMYTRARLVSEEGESLDIASFGPVSVRPEFQRMGIGSRLIRHSLPAAQKLGFGVVAIYGDPHNYCKHGFRNGKDLGISDGNGDYPHGLLALELAPGLLAGQHWRLQISPAYECSESAVEAFDGGFAPKLKGYQCSQEIFSIAVRSFLR
ncbi:MAG TPA: N-acetyltransferase [Anaerolineae bacterium]|nr:N-acetyltransferase [Anaerolineae bacterium]